jgi:hypothetical protein
MYQLFIVFFIIWILMWTFVILAYRKNRFVYIEYLGVICGWMDFLILYFFSLIIPDINYLRLGIVICIIQIIFIFGGPLYSNQLNNYHFLKSWIFTNELRIGSFAREIIASPIKKSFSVAILMFIMIEIFYRFAGIGNVEKYGDITIICISIILSLYFLIANAIDSKYQSLKKG